jgi:protein phosphatase
MQEKYFIVGDIHGCYHEFIELIDGVTDRKIISVGDLVDRGPASDKVLLWFFNNRHISDFVIGNHEDKLIRAINGNNVKLSHGLAGTIDQINKSNHYDFIIDEIATLCQNYYLDLDDEKLCVVHASYYKDEKRDGHISRNKALYGFTTGKKDEKGFPIRLDWAEEYTGDKIIVHGHVAVDEVVVKNNVWNIDTSCVFGGKLTGLFYPEMVIKQVPAKKTYFQRL